MSLTEKKETETNHYELAIHIEAADFEKAVEKSYRKNIKKINVPGFRPGKASRKMVERLYGAEVFYDGAFDEVCPGAVEDAVKEAGLKLVGRPELEVKEASSEKGVDMTAKCVVQPQVTLKEYKGLEAEKILKKASAKEVDQQIESMRERNARLVDANRASKKGDTMTFDFDGYIDGKPFKGGKAEKFSLELGSGKFIPGFEEQLENRNIDDEFDVNVTFPDEYQAEEVKGKPAVFKCKVHEIKQKELPALDDEFAKDVSEFDTLKDLKADIQKKMQERFDQAATNQAEDKLIEKLVDGMEAEIPQEMIRLRTAELIRETEYQMQMQGIPLDAYLKYTGMSVADFQKRKEEEAEKWVKTRLALEKVVELEKIVPTDAEIEEAYQKAADSYHMDVNEVKKRVSKDEFTEDIAVNKAIDLVKNSAKITETEEKAETEPKKAPSKAADAEKKPAAKTAKTTKAAAKTTKAADTKTEAKPKKAAAPKAKAKKEEK